ncbi:MAG TPA: TlpA disulfide reductase family protein [Bryobacteraceae bacterium]|nr:TlpA disulfide reductase family protein [Bryobacteraceae bacterium]
MLRLSPAAIVAIVALALFTTWITWRAKTLEQDLQSNAQRIALLHKAAPELRLPSLDGHTVSLADYRGRKKLVVFFWASWSALSHQGMLHLGMLYQRAHRPDSDFEIVAISEDDDRAAAQNFAKETKVPFPVLLDASQSASDAMQIRSIPALLVIDGAGTVVFGRAGFDPRMDFDLSRQLGISYNPMDFGAPNAGRPN